MENKSGYTMSREYEITWKQFGYDNILLLILLAIMWVLLLIWLIKGVD